MLDSIGLGGQRLGVGIDSGGPRREQGELPVQRLQTSDELKLAGGQPLEKSWLLKREKSGRYKRVIDSLDAYHITIGFYEVAGTGTTSDLVKTQLKEVERSTDSYIAKHQKGKRRPAFDALKVDIAAERLAITWLVNKADIPTCYDDLKWQNLKWTEAIEAVREAQEKGVDPIPPGVDPIPPYAGADRDMRVAHKSKALGKGGMSAVYPVDESVAGHERMLVKKPHLTAGVEDRQLANFKEELDRQLAVPRTPYGNLMKVYGRQLDASGKEVEGAVLKRVRGGELWDALDGLEKEYRNGKLASDPTENAKIYVGVLQRFAVDLMNGLAELHRAGVVHGDVHGGNAMLGHVRGRVKLIDYSATPLGEDPHIGHMYGAYAPEVAGVLPKHLYEMGYGAAFAQPRINLLGTDYPAMRRGVHDVHAAGGAQALDVFRAGHMIVEKLEGMGILDLAKSTRWKDASDFAHQLAKAPEHRPSAAKLLEHPFLTKLLINESEYQAALKVAGVPLTGPKPKAT